MDENTTSAAKVNLMKAEEYREHPDAGENQKKKRRNGKKLMLLIAAAAVMGVVAASIFQGVNWYRAKESGGAVSKESVSELEGISQGVVATADPGAVEGATVTDVSGVVQNVMPAVVAINCKVEKVSVSYDFFGRGHEQKEQGTSSGTGILIGQSERELFIVTNNHVIADAAEVTVEFCDKTTAVAEVKGTEENEDLAVVCVPFDGLSFETLRQIRLATVGNSDDLEMGEFVIAIGNALGYGQSVTVGYVSALDREVTTEGVTLDLIQVDAAINPGNSGGALLNANGEVVGINSVKYSDTDVERVGYAIPISEVLPIINDLMNREQLAEGESAYLGIVGKDVDAAHAKSFHMPVGICVTKVGEDSPAEQAGLHLGDIIVGINGRTVTTMEEYLHVLGYTRGGTEGTLQLKVLENGTYVDKELRVVFGYRGEGEDRGKR
ncbi:MAG: trypsin-like peptidase domain-containing protein [Lachnospiraceae bacterium]|nr:trypsin-like peptidase domain-containing protein [Lachnospiraceae bacterium]